MDKIDEIGKAHPPHPPPPRKKTRGSDVFTGDFYRTFNTDNHILLFKLYQNIKEKEAFQISFKEECLIVIPEADQHSIGNKTTHQYYLKIVL